MVIHGEVLAMAAMDEEMPKSPLKMPSEGVFIVVGKLLGGLVRDGVRGRRSRKIGEPVALRIGQNKRRVNRSEGRIAVMGRITVIGRIA